MIRCSVMLMALILVLLTAGALSADEPLFTATRLPVSGLKAGDQFGSAVAVGDKFIAVGAYLSNGGSGAVYLYERIGNTWSNSPRKLPGKPGEWFGFDVAFDAKTKKLIVGAPSPGKIGRVYICDPDSDCHDLAGGAPGDEFGSSVSADEDSVAVGARGANQRAGQVYVFKLPGIPREPLKFESSMPSAGAELGQSVSLRGKTLAVGAPLPGKDGKSPGAVYISTRKDDTDTWGPLKLIPEPSLEARSAFGYSVAVQNGNVVVGAPLSEGSGAVYKCDSLICAEWQSGKKDDQMGVAVAVDGDWIVTGARGTDRNQGAIYWNKAQLPRAGAKGSELGFGVAVRGLTIVAGAFREGSTGAAYVFEPETPACNAEIKLTSPKEPRTTSEDKTSLTFIAELTCTPALPISISLQGDKDEATVKPKNLLSIGKHTVTVTGEDDNECDGSRDYSLQVGDLKVPITNLDNDVCLGTTEDVCVTPEGVAIFEVTIKNVGVGRLEDGPGNEHLIEQPDDVRVVTATTDRGVVTVDHLSNAVVWNGSLPMGGEALVTILAPLEPVLENSEAAPAYDLCQ